jgi:nucleoid DNA-binding protein
MAKGSKAKSPTKSEILAAIADATNLSKKDVSNVLDALSNEIKKAIGSKGVGMFAVPGLVKIIRKKVDAKPARKGVMVLGQLRDLPAKPASVKVSVRALKNLKAML